MRKRLSLAVLCLLCTVFLCAAVKTKAPLRRIALNGEAEMDWLCGVPFEDPGWRVLDPAGEVCDDPVTVEDEPVVWRAGDYRVRYLLKDEKGRLLDIAVRLVHVLPQTLPETVIPPPGTICLSFDDGPSKNTGEVLDILERCNVKACFFIVADQTKYLDMLPRIVEAGHTLGVHCYDHDAYEWLYHDEETFFTDFMKAQEIIYEYTGDYAHVCRFPGGGWTASYLATTLEGGYDELYQILADMGVREYDWTHQPESVEKTTESTIAYFTHPEEPYDYGVILQHDSRLFSIRALERMIEWATKEGYRFARLDETFPEVHIRNR